MALLAWFAEAPTPTAFAASWGWVRASTLRGLLASSVSPQRFVGFLKEVPGSRQALRASLCPVKAEHCWMHFSRPRIHAIAAGF